MTTYSIVAAKLIPPLLNLVVRRGERIAAAKASLRTRRYYASNIRSNHEPLPEFLLSFLRGKHMQPSSTRSLRLSRLPTFSIQSNRNFSSSPTSKAVAVTINPRRDEEGRDMLVDITSRAATVRSLTVLFGVSTYS